MTHLSQTDLERWRDEGRPEDRPRVMTHLASCEACRRAYADLVRTGPLAEAPAIFDPAAFVGRGVGAYRPPRPWWKPPVWIAVPAAVAVLAAVGFVLPRPAPVYAPSATVRGTDIVAQAPAGDVTNVTEFRWVSPYAASRYRLTVRDEAGAVVFSTDVDTERVEVPSEVSARFRGRRHAWTVEALDPSGGVIAGSPPQAFDLR